MIKSIFRSALGSGFILLIPFILQLTIGTGVDGQGWNWKLGDFIVVGALLFIFGLLLQLVWRKFRILGAIVVILCFLWIYAELAVGVFTNLGS